MTNDAIRRFIRLLILLFCFFNFMYLLSFIVACHQVNDDKFFADFTIPSKPRLEGIVKSASHFI